MTDFQIVEVTPLKVATVKQLGNNAVPVPYVAAAPGGVASLIPEAPGAAVIPVGIQGPPGVSALDAVSNIAATVNSNTVSPLLLVSLPAGARICDLRLNFTRQFDYAYTLISIGTTADPQAFVAVNENQPTYADEFRKEEEFILSVATDVKLFITTQSGTPGTCEASVSYIKE